MKKILNVDCPEDYTSYVGATCPHPLVAVIDFARISPIPSSLNSYGVYGIFMHSKVRSDLTYGNGVYLPGSGMLICVAPGQIGGREEQGDLIDIDGWALLFHPNLLVGTALEKEIRRFSFFDYSANEALFMGDVEQEMFVSIIRSIRDEIDNGADDGEKRDIIVGYISVLLHYCNRFYNRQFSTIRRDGEDLLVKFSHLINDYFERGLQFEHGIPGVQYFADKMCMSASYFSDMMRKSTGENAGNFIRGHIVRMAKNRLIATGNVAQVAYGLGFDYPHHFSRMFKRQTGLTPTDYLRQNLKV